MLGIERIVKSLWCPQIAQYDFCAIEYDFYIYLSKNT